jgi:hypothetical protein
MTLHRLTQRHSRPLHGALLGSAVAVAMTLAAGTPTLAESDHDRGRHHGDDHDGRGDHGRGDWNDGGHGDDRGRWSRDDQRYPGYRHRDDDRDRHDGHDWDHRDYRYGHSHDYYGHGYRGYYDRGYHDRGYHGPHAFVVPRTLDGYGYGGYGDYGRYFRGTVFYAPHHHPHRVFYFPVLVNGYVEYLPHAYCGDAFFPGQYGYGGAYGGARGYFDLHLRF